MEKMVMPLESTIVACELFPKYISFPFDNYAGFRWRQIHLKWSWFHWRQIRYLIWRQWLCFDRIISVGQNDLRLVMSLSLRFDDFQQMIPELKKTADSVQCTVFPKQASAIFFNDTCNQSSNWNWHRVWFIWRQICFANMFASTEIQNQ